MTKIKREPNADPADDSGSRKRRIRATLAKQAQFHVDTINAASKQTPASAPICTVHTAET